MKLRNVLWMAGAAAVTLLVSAPTDLANAAGARPVPVSQVSTVQPAAASSGVRPASTADRANTQANAQWIAWCKVSATTPFTLTHSSRNIYAEGKFVSCGGTRGKPDACHMGVDLEQYDAHHRVWRTFAHNGGSWKACRGKVQTVYRSCTHVNTVHYYRSAVWIQVEKDGRFSTPAWAYSTANHFYCI
ncbi:MAG TPA: hypothetical protein VLJ59_02185 [Mycobacteriales bacterium]|nr:hypothetical protein [Mycobacteriales bacterium]